MYCVGLTGSIGSGKSTVAYMFAQHGVEIINADLIAKELTRPEMPAFTAIIRHFGNEVLNDEGQLHRAWLREQIIRVPADRQWLEQLLHPMIRMHIATMVQKPSQTYYMIEIPLLMAKKDYPYLNRILLVLSQPNLQIQRIIQRDNSTLEQAQLILDNQA
ncbi:MAG TPA: dephospho-CoA kinase, partial [Legionellaceae bacterium]|nr:dephospho-CoA kinase [Legionellaceae bacterium]